MEAFEPNTFRDVVSKAQLLEKGYYEERIDRDQPSKKLKFNDNQQNKGRFRVGGRPERVAGYSSTSMGRRCPICRGNHSPNICPDRRGKCYTCGKPGHTRHDCPNNRNFNRMAPSPQERPLALPQPPQPLYMPSPSSTTNHGSNQYAKTTGYNQPSGAHPNNKEKSRGGNRARVFNLTQKSAEESNNVVTGNFLICSYPGVVLFDSGDTHSFISAKFISEHKINSRRLESIIFVETPLESKSANLICNSCSIEIGGWRLLDDLIVL